MTNLVLSNTALMDNPIFKELQKTTDTLAGGSGEYRRISIKGGKFRQMVGGDQIGKPVPDEINVVIIDAAPIARMYFEGSYDPNNATPPTCWSEDTKAPADKVPEDQRQASKCDECPQAIKGSGQGNSAACRFSQRLAVAVEGDMKVVYQMNLPSKSLFGAAEGGNMPMQAYAKMLKAHKVPAIAVMTTAYFDEDSETPKLFFKPARMLDAGELEQAVALRDSDQTKDAITLTVSEADGVAPKVSNADKVVEEPVAEKKKPAKKPAKKVAAEEVTEEEEEEIPEPTKVSRSKSVKPEEIDDDLASLIEDWD